jgi:hypothetical protein
VKGLTLKLAFRSARWALCAAAVWLPPLRAAEPTAALPAPSHGSHPAPEQNGKPPLEPANTTFPPGVSTPLRIGVALTVNNIAKINESAGTFEGDIDLQLRWRDPRLAFDSKEVGTDRQEYGYEAATAKLASIWNPQVTLANMTDKPTRTEAGLFIYSDGQVIQIQRIRALFDTKYKLSAFPFDTEPLTIRLLCNRYSINEVEFVQDQKDIDQSSIRDSVRIAGWHMAGMDFSPSRIRGWNGDYFPQFAAQINIARDPSSHIFVIFVPFLLILLVPTILTLYAKVDTGPRLAAWSGSLLALVAFNFTLSVRYPALDSRSLTAQIVAIGFCYQLFMICLSISILDRGIADRMGHLAEEIAGFLRWSVPLALVGLILTRIYLTSLATI